MCRGHRFRRQAAADHVFAFRSMRRPVPFPAHKSVRRPPWLQHIFTQMWGMRSSLGFTCQVSELNPVHTTIFNMGDHRILMRLFPYLVNRAGRKGWTPTVSSFGHFLRQAARISDGPSAFRPFWERLFSRFPRSQLEIL
jgi:hypothetical protein